MVEIKHRVTGEVLLRLDPTTVFAPASLDAAVRRGWDGVIEELTLETGIEGAQLPGANLREADLGWQLLIAANLEGACLDEALLEGAIFERANLRGVTLRNAYCLLAQFTGADLTDADLTGAMLKVADLYGAELGGATLTGAIYDASTRWPRGFDPERHGAMRK
jgi:hypothetical protein